MSPLIIAIVGAVLLVLFIAMFILSRIKVAGPNEAFIVTGRKGRALFMPLRLALTGRESGPEMAPLLARIGRDRAIQRLHASSSD